MAGFERGLILHGWDDEKVYFWDAKIARDWCVSDHPDLVARLVAICQEYFAELEQAPEGPSNKR